MSVRVHEEGTPTNHSLTPRGKEDMRRFNLAAALSIVHDRGPISRAQLFEALGLGRTTVFELLGQLAELGLVTDGKPIEQVGVGRPSLLVHASSSVGAFVVNPELQALTVGICTLDGTLTTRSHPWTPAAPDEAAELCAHLLHELRAELAPVQIAGIGAGVPGQVDAHSRIVVSAPSLGWEGVDFARLLAERLKVNSYIENNARLVTATQQRMGVAHGCDDFIYLFANAGGIGGGIVSGGRILVGNGGFAGEIGHIHVADAKAEGKLESVIRRRDLVAAFGVDDPNDDELDDLVATTFDPEVQKIAQRYLGTLGVVIANLVNTLDARLVLLGGFLGSLYRRFPEEFEGSLRAFALPAVRQSLEVLPTLLTTESVLRGAAELVFADLVADPFSWSSMGEPQA